MRAVISPSLIAHGGRRCATADEDRCRHRELADGVAAAAAAGKKSAQLIRSTMRATRRRSGPLQCARSPEGGVPVCRMLQHSSYTEHTRRRRSFNSRILYI